MIISFSFPKETNCLLKSGQKVDFTTPFLEKNQEEEIKISLTQELNIHSKDIFRCLKKVVGDEIKKGELIALKKNFFSLKKITAPADGLIQEVSHETGEIILKVKKNEKNIINAFFTGEITEIKNNVIHFKVKKKEEYPIKSATNNFGGQVFYFKENETDFNAEDIENKTVVSEKYHPYIQLKIEVLGAKGFVSLNKLPQETELDFCQLKLIGDLEKIFSHQLPYCLIDKNSSKIYFYSL
ncbi:MAG: hypothetical protein N2482_01345 [Patescibacteria group bacterium]|nr:hypothetical protein [Patescibacteria group bacterium]